MKLFVYGLFTPFLAIILFACTPTEKKVDVPPPPKAEEQATQPPAPAGPAPQAAPESSKQIIENYQKGLTSSIDKARGAQAKVDMGAVQDAVRNYQVENGRYPDSLDAIKSYVSPKVNLGLYNYDPGTGTVSIK
jgi:hypothetical protein